MEGRSGVYFLSNEYKPTGYFLVKVGVAVSNQEPGVAKRYGGLRRRLESYLLCYPRGYYLFGVLTTRYDKAFKVERSIQQYLTGKGRKAVFPHSHIEEWYWLRADEISNIIELHDQAPRVPVVTYQTWDPYLKIHANPTEGKQRKIKPIDTPGRKEREKHSHTIKPPSTMKKAKQRFIKRYESDMDLAPEVLHFK